MRPANPFLAEILAAPQDDAPRLIWADWLEERGDPRAEFIRVQCAAARLPAWDVRRRELELRATQIWRVHHPKWMAELPQLQGAVFDEFHRGMPEQLMVVDWSALGEHGLERAFKAAPISALGASWIPAATEVLRKAPPGLAQIRELLDVRGALAAGLAAASIPVRLERLWICPQIDYPLEGLYEAVARHQLESLRLMHMHGRLVPFSSQQRLRSLTIMESTLERNDLRFLTSAPPFSNLESLAIFSTQLASDALGVIATGLAMQSLRSLKLARVGRLVIHDRLTAYLPHLAELILDAAGLGDIGLIPLLKSPGFLGLRTLYLGSNGITLRGIRRLAESPLLRRLQVLDLSHNHLGDLGAQALADSPYASGLKFLKLHDAGLGDTGALALARSPHLQGLVSLSLHNNRLTNAAASRLREIFDLDLAHEFERIPNCS